MKQQLRRGWWRLADYGYVAYWQLAGPLGAGSVEQYQRPSEPGRPPVVIVPGIYESWHFMRPLARQLHGQGFPVHFVRSLGFNHGSIADMARLVADYLTDHGLTDVVIVAHSKGGLIGKYAMIHHDADHRICAMAAINAPFAGSPYARWIPLVAVQALFPTNGTLTALTANRSINSRITAISSQFDTHIPGRSALGGAVNVELATPGHFRALSDPNLLPLILAAVRRAQPDR